MNEYIDKHEMVIALAIVTNIQLVTLTYPK